MKYLIKLSIGLLLLTLPSIPSQAGPPEIHCKHFIHGYPLGAPASNDLIIRDLYALSSNDTTKFTDWVCYYLTTHETTGTLDLDRKWRNDPWLSEDETLEGTPKSKDDYKGANAAFQYERGHLAPLASFKGSRYASQVNYYSNITPQKKKLNGGAWKELENSVRDLVDRYGHAWVMTGPLYEKDMDKLPKADEAHKVPSGFWKIIAVRNNGTFKVAAFNMNQDAESTEIIDYMATVREVETRSQLDFFWQLSQEEQDNLETTKNEAWVKEWPCPWIHRQ